MRTYFLMVAWTLLAGAGIPLVGVLNNGIARSVGNPVAATAVTFAIALLVAAAVTVPFYGVPSLQQLTGAPFVSYAPGLILAFYALSATIIIPRFGAASFVAFILIAQLVTSALVDQFGLFGMIRRPIDGLRLAGLLVVASGILLMELANQRKA